MAVVRLADQMARPGPPDVHFAIALRVVGWGRAQWLLALRARAEGESLFQLAYSLSRRSLLRLTPFLLPLCLLRVTLSPP
jgi:hypothetical protein